MAVHSHDTYLSINSGEARRMVSRQANRRRPTPRRTRRRPRPGEYDGDDDLDDDAAIRRWTTVALYPDELNLFT